MDLQGNKILITGGASGIGFAFAERFLQAGNEVLYAAEEKASCRKPETSIRN